MKKRLVKTGVAASLLVLATVAIIAAGCGGGGSVSVTPATGSGSATVKEVATSAASFDGKTVVLDGYYAPGSCTSCFLIKDGPYSVRVEGTSTVPVPTDAETGAKIKVSGTIRVVNGSPDLSATGLEFL